MQGLGWVTAPLDGAVSLGALFANGYYFAGGGVAVGAFDLSHTKAGGFLFDDPITDVNGG